MSDKRKTIAASAPKPVLNNKVKRPSTVTIPTVSKSKLNNSVMPSQTLNKGRNQLLANKANMTIQSECDQTVLSNSIPEINEDQRQIAYGHFLRSMLEDCLLEEKIEPEETEIDVQMMYLAKRFQETMEQLDKTNRRMKDISFVVEQKRLLDIKNNDCSKFYAATEESASKKLLDEITKAEESSLDRLKLKNVDFGYDKDSGHMQLLDAVNDAINGLEDIKKRSKLDSMKFKVYEEAESKIEEIEKDKMELETLKQDFEKRFPNFGEQLFKEASNMINKFMGKECEDEEDEQECTS